MNISSEYKALECWHKVHIGNERTVSDYIGQMWFEHGLVFGDTYPATRCNKALIVRAADPGPHVDGAKVIVCPIQTEARFVPIMGGYMARSATMDDVFSQFPGPYDLITAINSGRERGVFFSKNVLDSLARVYILSDDGHNEYAIKRADEMGYRVIVCEGAIIMGRQLW